MNAHRYRNPAHCLSLTIKEEGTRGLLRGLGATFAREVPGNALFFSVYEVRYNLDTLLRIGLPAHLVVNAGMCEHLGCPRKLYYSCFCFHVLLVQSSFRSGLCGMASASGCVAGCQAFFAAAPTAGREGGGYQQCG